MKRQLILLIIFFAAGSRCFGQETGPLENLSPAERERAGLDKLSPAERAYLNQLLAHAQATSNMPANAAPSVGANSGINTPASPGVPSRPAQPANATLPTNSPSPLVTSVPSPPRNSPDFEEPSSGAVGKRASESTSASEGGGWLHWLRPKPEKKKEVPVIESEISGQLSGWNAHSILTLTNGQRWAVSDYSMRSFVHPLNSPKVRVTPTSVFGYLLEIPEVDLQIRVRPAN